MSLECIVPSTLWHTTKLVRVGPVFVTTRMTVLRLHDGSLWVHSPISPTPQLIHELATIGTVRYIIAPNKSHHLFFLDFLKAHPSATGYIAVGLDVKRPDLKPFPPIPLKAPWSSELQSFFIYGLPVINETAWFHPSTRTLLLTDLLFCFSRDGPIFAQLVTRLLGVHGKLGMSRTMKLLVKDKRALARSIAPLLSLPVERIIVAHDEIVDEQPVAKLAQAFAWLGEA